VLSAAGLLFDCDGVLVDSDEAVAQAWDSWAAEYAPGFDFARDINQGRPAAETVAELVPSRDCARATRALKQLEIDSALMVRALPGAAELLPLLPDGTWTVVTSGVLAVARARLSAAGLPCPKDLVTADDVRQGKPAPDPYLIGAQRLGIAPVRGGGLRGCGSGGELGPRRRHRVDHRRRRTRAPHASAPGSSRPA